MPERPLLRTLLAGGAATLALLLVAPSVSAGPSRSDWLHYITPDGVFHATRDPAAVPPEAAPLQPARTARRGAGELCDTVQRLDARGLGYWARHGVLRVQAEAPVRACLDQSSRAIAHAMARHCREHGTGGYQIWSDLVSRALRDCEG